MVRATIARATRQVGAANPVIPDFNDRQVSLALDLDGGLGCLSLHGDVGQRPRAEGVNGHFDGWCEPLVRDGHPDWHLAACAQLAQGYGQPSFG